MNTIEIARKAGLATSDRGRPNGYAEYCKRLEQFARLVAEAERERCAKVAEQYGATLGVAAEIRALEDE